MTARRRPIMVSRPAAKSATHRRPGEKVEVEVTELSGTDVHVKFSSEGGSPESGIIELREFSAGAPPIGSKHPATFLDEAPGKSGFSLFTLRQPTTRVQWDKVKVGDLVEGMISEVNTGGVVVNLDGNRGFMPTSQVSRNVARAVGGMLSQPIAGEVTRLNPKKKELTLGLRHLFDHRIKAEKARVFSQFQKGQKLDGKVVRLNEHGAFVDLGGIDGLLHKSKIERHQEENSETAATLEVGSSLPIEILYVDEERGRIGLGFQRAGKATDTSRASSGKLSDYEVGEVVSGMVRRVDSNGLVMMIEERVEGWLSASHFGDVAPEKGAILKAKIRSLDSARGKIELEPADGGLGQRTWNPFQDVQNS